MNGMIWVLVKNYEFHLNFSVTHFMDTDSTKENSQ